MAQATAFDELVEARESRYRSASDYAADAVREAILSGVFPQGAPLRQEDLARRLSISRMPVREALRTLQAEGLVTFRSNHGFTVTECSGAQIIEIAEIRYSLESLALRTAIDRHTPKSLQAVDEALAALNQVENREGLNVRPARHRRFHLALYQPCGRERLLMLVESNLGLWESISRIGSSQFSFVVARDKTEHAQLVEAVRSANADRALQVLEHHILGQAQQVADNLERLSQTAQLKAETTSHGD